MLRGQEPAIRLHFAFTVILRQPSLSEKALLQPMRYVSLKHAYCRAEYKFTELLKHWVKYLKRKKYKMQEFIPKNTTTGMLGRGDP